MGRKAIKYEYRGKFLSVFELAELPEAKGVKAHTIKRRILDGWSIEDAVNISHYSSNRRHHMCDTRIYHIWENIVQRCTNHNNPRYNDYGGRDIKIYDEWKNDFISFYKYVGDPPSDEHTIDREDNSIGYEPGNVKWATQDEQHNNRRDNIHVIYNGEKINITVLERRLGFCRGTLAYRVTKLNLSIEEAISMPKYSRKIR